MNLWDQISFGEKCVVAGMFIMGLGFAIIMLSAKAELSVVEKNCNQACYPYQGIMEGDRCFCARSSGYEEPCIKGALMFHMEHWKIAK